MPPCSTKGKSPAGVSCVAVRRFSLFWRLVGILTALAFIGAVVSAIPVRALAGVTHIPIAGCRGSVDYPYAGATAADLGWSGAGADQLAAQLHDARTAWATQADCHRYDWGASNGPWEHPAGESSWGGVETPKNESHTVTFSTTELTVPTVSTASPWHMQDLSAWTGIGGTHLSDPLYQDGVEMQIDLLGHRSYRPWAETLQPGVSDQSIYPILSVRPKDRILLTTWWKAGVVHYLIANLTTHHDALLEIPAPWHPKHSAENIVEAPLFAGGFARIPRFTGLTFSHSAYAAGLAVVPIRESASVSTLVSRTGRTLATVGPLEHGAFSVLYRRSW